MSRIRGASPRGFSQNAEISLVALQTVAQTLGNGAVVPIEYQKVLHDSHGIFQRATPATMRIPVSGVWGISFITQWTHNNTGSRYIQLYIDNVNEGSFARDGADLGAFNLEVDAFFEIDMEAGEELELRAFQDSGGNLNFVINVVGPRFVLALLRRF